MTLIPQPKPDFSGEWILNRQASSVSPVAAAFQTGVMRIEHREPMFRCQAAFVADGTPFEYTFELRSDRHEVAETHGERRTISSLRWDGDVLVSVWQIEGPDGALTISFRYELEEGGRRLRAVEQLRGGGRDQDNLWVLERP